RTHRHEQAEPPGDRRAEGKPPDEQALDEHARDYSPVRGEAGVAVGKQSNQIEQRPEPGVDAKYSAHRQPRAHSGSLRPTCRVVKAVDLGCTAQGSFRNTGPGEIRY